MDVRVATSPGFNSVMLVITSILVPVRSPRLAPFETAVLGGCGCDQREAKAIPNITFIEIRLVSKRR
jgi:hypothetical protein